MSDVHLKFQNWNSYFPNLFHLHLSLPHPSWCLSQKFWSFFILLFLSHVVSNRSEDPVGAIFKIYSEFDHWLPLLLLQPWSQLASSGLLTFSSKHFIMKILKYKTKLMGCLGGSFHCEVYSFYDPKREDCFGHLQIPAELWIHTELLCTGITEGEIDFCLWRR